MILKYTLILIVSSLSLGLCKKFRYENYTLYKALPEDEQQMKFLLNMQDFDTRFDFWNEPGPFVKYALIVSSPDNKYDLETIFNENKIKYEIKMNNVQEAIDKEVVNAETRSAVTNMQWNVYYTLDQINSWLDSVVSAHQNGASIIKGGESYEKRDIRGIRISHGSGRRAIFIEAGIHAREWISPSSACYLINELLNSPNPDIQAAARDYDWYIFPIFNPDGYLWSHEQFRLWRKNRRPVGNTYGVDLNRNWNNNWLVIGSNLNPESDRYAGPGPFSEPESRSLSRYIRSLRNKLDLYITIHSFGQLLLIPFGNSTAPYANYHDALNIGRRAMGALSVRYGTQYVTGNIAEAIFFASGSSLDWVKEHLQVPLAYAYELRDRGDYGFLLPVDQILPNHQEFMDSLIDLIHQAKRFGYMQNSAHSENVSILMIVVAALTILFQY